MIRKFVLFAMTALLVLTSIIQGQSAPPADITTADQAWLEGKYATALRDYAALLKAPGGDQYLEQIALQTGELYQTEEITTDGRTPRLSPNGSLFLYEIGTPQLTITRVLQTTGDHKSVAELPGVSAVISPSGQKAAYIKPKQNDEIAKAQTALDAAPAQGPERTAAQQALNRLHQK